jgi:hypothetical protein
MYSEMITRRTCHEALDSIVQDRHKDATHLRVGLHCTGTPSSQLQAQSPDKLTFMARPTHLEMLWHAHLPLHLKAQLL